MTYIMNRWTVFSQKRIEISSTQRLLKVFKKQRENKKCETLIFLFVIISCFCTQSKQVMSSNSSSTRWSSSSFSDYCNSGVTPKFSRCTDLTLPGHRLTNHQCSHYFDNYFKLSSILSSTSNLILSSPSGVGEGQKHSQKSFLLILGNTKLLVTILLGNA